MTGGHSRNETAYELVYFDLGRKLDFFELLLLLEHVRTGFFAAVHLATPSLPSPLSPPLSLHSNTWSRVRHSSADQPPLRSRKHPLGLCSLSPQSQTKVDQSNRELEIVTWLLEQATLCTRILLIFLEDLGGREHSGPATIWNNTHLHKLDGASEVQRGATFLRQIASTESRRPVGLFTNLAWVKSQMAAGRPRLYTVGSTPSLRRTSPWTMFLHDASRANEPFSFFPFSG